MCHVKMFVLKYCHCVLKVGDFAGGTQKNTGTDLQDPEGSLREKVSSSAIEQVSARVAMVVEKQLKAS